MQEKHKRTFWALTTALALALSASLSAATEKKPSQDKVAVVNGSVITKAIFDREMASLQQRLLRKGRPPDGSQPDMKKETLEMLINRELLYQESQNKGVKIDKAAIDEQMKTLKKRFTDDAQFKEVLTKMKTSEASMRSHFKQGLAIQQFIDTEIAPKATIPDKDLKEYYDKYPQFFKQPEKVRASHILIRVAPKAKEARKAEAHKKLKDVQKKLKKGEDFSALAKESSQCPSSSRGGDLGYFTRGQMVKSFEEVAFALKPGDVSGIVETNFGYHLIKVIEKKPGSVIAYDEVKDKLGQHLKQDKVRKEVGLYVEKLKEKAKIEIFLTETP